ncbi:MAG TPA: PAS domain S-box protein [Leptospiraceae bacterium]|nr:PAS domain S-box protein [Leptospiraceae bacterium]HMX31263.1 PAS domain S-box protein [Leptospiraceae bacterium]HMY29469.1 PAS domain S-box protein [Leptospiraceae bacterium]HMZ64756.1 PAS domain S-box protein [Leptospiraceae bacterium]HNA06344.1 PAS domain S-box protein [Leptospiraceae bacterium]
MKQEDLLDAIPHYLLHSKSQIAFILDEQGKFLISNYLFKDTFGEPKHQREFESIFEQNAKLENLIQQLKNDPQEIQSIDLRVKLNKLYKSISFEVSYLKNKDKNIGYIFIGYLNLNESSSFLSLELKCKAILECTQEVFILIDRNGIILAFNKTAFDMIFRTQGKELKESRPMIEFIMDTDLESFSKNFKTALLGNSVHFEKQFQFYGYSLWADISYLPIRENENVIAVAFVAYSIDDKKMSELKMQQNENILTAIYNSSSEGTLFLDLDLRILFFNKVAAATAQAIFQKELEIGTSALDYLSEYLKDDFLGYFHRAKKGESIVIEETDGIKWWLFSMFPVYDENKNMIGIANNVQEITSEKENEFKIIHQRARLKEIAWQQSHRVRQHVANILGLCNLFLNHKDRTEEEKDRSIEYIFKSARELDQVIHEIVRQTEEQSISI